VFAFRGRSVVVSGEIHWRDTVTSVCARGFAAWEREVKKKKNEKEKKEYLCKEKLGASKK